MSREARRVLCSLSWMARLVRRMACWGASSSFCMYSSTNWSSSSSGTTRVTRPIRSASSPFTVRAVQNMSRALSRPTSRGRK